MWDNINFIINKRRPSSHIDKHQIDDKEYLQPNSISNVINIYFCNIPRRLASKLPKSNRHFTSYLKPIRSQFHFILMHEIEVFIILDTLDVKKTTDQKHRDLLDQFKFKVIKCPLGPVGSLQTNASVALKFLTDLNTAKFVKLKCRLNITTITEDF